MIEDYLTQLKKNAKDNFVPIVRDKTLDAMLEIIKASQPKRILEIGTAVGYSALNMLSVCGAHIVTIEKDDQRAIDAENNFLKAGCLDRVTLIHGDAIDVLANLSQENQQFDFVFLDGPKGQYIKYLPFILHLLTAKGIIFADNVGLLGLVADGAKVNHKNRTMVRNMQAFLHQIQNDESLESKIYDVDDGYAIIVKK